jgi:hypothetical protein
MKIEKLDRIVMYVKDIDEAKERFSRLLNITFEEIPAEGVEPASLEPGPKALELAADQPPQTPQENQAAPRVAISPSGLELMEGDIATMPGQTEGIRCFHFKVSDYEGAKAEMEERGVPLLTDITLGKLREAIYHPDDLNGAMMGLVSYPTATAMEAIKTKGD